MSALNLSEMGLTPEEAANVLAAYEMLRPRLCGSELTLYEHKTGLSASQIRRADKVICPECGLVVKSRRGRWPLG